MMVFDQLGTRKNFPYIKKIDLQSVLVQTYKCKASQYCIAKHLKYVLVGRRPKFFCVIHMTLEFFVVFYL